MHARRRRKLSKTAKRPSEYVYIYVLCEPDTLAIRYVGLTKDTDRRWKGHALYGIPSLRMSAWLNDLRKRHLSPHMITLATVARGTERLAERLTIMVLKECGCDLLNTQHNSG